MWGKGSMIEKGGLWERLKRQRLLQLFTLVGILYLIVFNYVPMFGILMAFKDYRITMGIAGIFTSKWVGFKQFEAFFSDINFWMLIRNTVALSVLKLFFSFPLPIVFALMLNEVRSKKFKRFTQTISYLPHFVSWVIVSGLALGFLSNDSGVVNLLLKKIGLIHQSIPFLTSANMFWPVAVMLDIWKDMGWWTIIFLAAITGIDPSLYESADIDGASRLRKMWSITLPSIRSTVSVVLILAMGNLFGGGLSGSNFDQSYLLGNAMNYDHSQIIQTYVLQIGLSNGRYAYATAVGLIQSIISLILIFGSNAVSKRLSKTSLF